MAGGSGAGGRRQIHLAPGRICPLPAHDGKGGASSASHCCRRPACRPGPTARLVAGSGSLEAGSSCWARRGARPWPLRRCRRRRLPRCGRGHHGGRGQPGWPPSRHASSSLCLHASTITSPLDWRGGHVNRPAPLQDKLRYEHGGRSCVPRLVLLLDSTVAPHVSAAGASTSSVLSLLMETPN